MKTVYNLQVSLNAVNYSKRLMYWPTYRSTVVRRVTTPFTAFSSISWVMSATFWWMASFCTVSDAGWSRYTFDFKDPYSQKL